MRQKHRLTTGGIIDRSKQFDFKFNNKSYTGYKGDTLASALLANGVHLVGRSFKYHRPRGIMAAGVEDPNSMVQLGSGGRSEPNVKATELMLFDGLEATSVNCWPSVDFDLYAAMGLFSRFMPAGFYYKTMFASRRLWHGFFEPFIRRSAGWGVVPGGSDPDCYDSVNVHCDVMVVGAGASGLAAARAAAVSGARVILVDANSEIGGGFIGLKAEDEDSDLVDISVTDWIGEQADKLSDYDNVTILKRTTAFGFYDDNYVLALQRVSDHTGGKSSFAKPRTRLWHIRAGRVIIATGAHERPLVFADNDRPGVMLASAVRTYYHRYGVLAGRKAVVFTNNDDAYNGLVELKAAGLDVQAVIDVRRDLADIASIAKVRDSGIEIVAGSAIVATSGNKRVDGVAVQLFDGTNVTGKPRYFDCDLIIMSGGWSPVVHLHSQRGGKVTYDDNKGCFVPATAPDNDQSWQSVGAANGNFLLSSSLTEGWRAGCNAANDCGFEAPPSDSFSKLATDTVVDNAGNIKPIWLIPGKNGSGKGKHFVDWQNDTTVFDIKLAVREGFDSVEHMKRYTLSGFGTDQGKTGNINALAILASTTGQSINQTGTTTFRPPYVPITFGSFAARNRGQLAQPVRVTSIHSWHVDNGAMFEDVGQWKRPWYFPVGGETMRQAVARECAAVRESVGVLDGSTLGKIVVRGPDAAKFLNLIYTNAWSKLKSGHCRYGLMCKEDGMVFDDGVTTRIDKDTFYMTTTTGGAANVFAWLEEYLQTEWPHLQVYCTSVTEQWSTVSVAGPKARAVMQELAPQHDWSNDAFPFMTMQEVKIGECPARVFRISFTGELSYEINVPNRYGLSLWQAVMATGKPYNITPYGTETMHVLRAEKGYIIAGQETDGTVTPYDLGMSWIVSTKKDDFIGKRSFDRPDTKRPDRMQLVGLLTDDPEVVLEEGAQLSDNARGARPVKMIGHVTSSYWSAALGRSIALGLVVNGQARHEEIVDAYHDGMVYMTRIVEPVFYDKKGECRDG